MANVETQAVSRRLPVGAEVVEGGVHFRVWAPARRRVEVVCEGVDSRAARRGRPVRPEDAAAGRAQELEAEEGGYFSGLVEWLQAGDLYRLRLDGEASFPDPVSRFQPRGPHGPSRVVDPKTFVWSDAGWSGPACRGHVIYEMHVGTFTPEGTWAAAERQLPALAELGISVVEVMPVAEFPGRFGWGYDGVDLFAPSHLYGEPDDCRRFVAAAHALGLAVILDVVYNHLGPDGNFLKEFSATYFTDRVANEWGEALNFDGPGCEGVRELFVANAGYWIVELHFDGLRLDATQQIHDRSPEHLIAAVARRVRAAGAALPPGRRTYLVAENESQDSRLVRPPEEGGHGLDALWNDDFHHSAMVALDGRREAYYSDYQGTPQELVSAVRRGYLFQGQRCSWQDQRRGTPTTGLAPEVFITYLQNHDQVANSARGERCHLLAMPGVHRALTALLLLGPGTPLLFQGQEWSAASPFLYFADHHAELAQAVRRGRESFLAQFPRLGLAAMRAGIPDPADPATFEACRLDRSESGREPHAGALRLHRDLLRLRREDPVFSLQGAAGVDGAVLGAECFVLRFFAPPAAPGGESGDRLLVVNLGRDQPLPALAEPLLAPPAGASGWEPLLSTEEPGYGGGGPLAPEDADGRWLIPAACAVALLPRGSAARGRSER